MLSVLEDDDEDADDAVRPDRRGWVRIAVIVGTLLVAAYLLPVLGYVLTMTLLLAVVLVGASEQKVWISLLVAIGTALASHLVFAGWLGTALPASRIGLLAGLGL